MSTEIYEEKSISQDQIVEEINKNERLHIDWLINEIIRHQLPEIKENLLSCISRLDENDQTEYKLPLSSHNSEAMKGTIVRKNFKITGLNLSVKVKTFNNGRPIIFRLEEGKELIVRQLLDCHDSMENAISTLNKLIQNKQLDSIIFIKYIEQIIKDIGIARKSLNEPNQAYVFPQLRPPQGSFIPPLPDIASLDIITSNSELRVDFFSLSLITQRPWNLIIDRKQRISFADMLRKVISTERRRTINEIICNEYSKLIESRKENNNDNEEGFVKQAMSIFGTTGNPSLSTLLKTANQYLEQSVTFINEKNEPIVVKTEETKSVITSDPVLLSISVKLDSLDKALVQIRSNLKNI